MRSQTSAKPNSKDASSSKDKDLESLATSVDTDSDVDLDSPIKSQISKELLEKEGEVGTAVPDEAPSNSMIQSIEQQSVVSPPVPKRPTAVITLPLTPSGGAPLNLPLGLALLQGQAPSGEVRPTTSLGGDAAQAKPPTPLENVLQHSEQDEVEQPLLPLPFLSTESKAKPSGLSFYSTQNKTTVGQKRAGSAEPAPDQRLALGASGPKLTKGIPPSVSSTLSGRMISTSSKIIDAQPSVTPGPIWESCPLDVMELLQLGVKPGDHCVFPDCSLSVKQHRPRSYVSSTTSLSTSAAADAGVLSPPVVPFSMSKDVTLVTPSAKRAVALTTPKVASVVTTIPAVPPTTAARTSSPAGMNKRKERTGTPSPAQEGAPSKGTVVPPKKPRTLRIPRVSPPSHPDAVPEGSTGPLGNVLPPVAAPDLTGPGVEPQPLATPTTPVNSGINRVRSQIPFSQVPIPGAWGMGPPAMTPVLNNSVTGISGAPVRPWSSVVNDLISQNRDMFPKWVTPSTVHPSCRPFFEAIEKYMVHRRDVLPMEHWPLLLPVLVFSDTNALQAVNELVLEPNLSWAEARSILMARFDLVDAHSILERRLQDIRQHDVRNITGYNQEFREVLRQMSRLDALETTTYVSRYVTGLHPVIRDDFERLRARMVTVAFYRGGAAASTTETQDHSKVPLVRVMETCALIASRLVVPSVATGVPLRQKDVEEPKGQSGKRKHEAVRPSADRCSLHPFSDHSNSECRARAHPKGARNPLPSTSSAAKPGETRICRICNTPGHISFQCPHRGDSGRNKDSSVPPNTSVKQDSMWKNRAAQALMNVTSSQPIINSLAAHLRKTARDACVTQQKGKGSGSQESDPEDQ